MTTFMSVVTEDLAANGALEILRLIFEAVGIILTVIAFYDWIRPKVKNKHTVLCYFNYESEELVEELEFEISWPHLSLFKTISLPKIPRNARYEIAYSSAISPRQALESEHYVDVGTGRFRRIKLVNKEFFIENEVESIYLTFIIPQSAGYKDKIQDLKEDGKITILNRNLVEVRNYKVHFPKMVTLDKANQYFPLIERFETSRSRSEEVVIEALILKPLPAARSGEPGKVIIPLD